MNVDELATRVTDATRNTSDAGREQARKALSDAYQQACGMLRLGSLVRTGVALVGGQSLYSWDELGLGEVVGIQSISRRSSTMAGTAPARFVTVDYLSMLKFNSPTPVSWAQGFYTLHGTAAIELYPAPGDGETVDLAMYVEAEELATFDQEPLLLPSSRQDGLVDGALYRLARTYPQRVNRKEAKDAFDDWIRDTRRWLSQFEGETPIRAESGYPWIGAVSAGNDRDWR